MSSTQIVRIILNGHEGRTSFSFDTDDQWLEAMRSLLERGWLERLSVYYEGKVRTAYVDEEGIFKKLAPNYRASSIANTNIFGKMLIDMGVQRDKAKQVSDAL